MTVQPDIRNDLIRQLQDEVFSLQGFKRAVNTDPQILGLGPIEQAFPGHIFPIGAVHEFISPAMEDTAATNGFIAGLLGKLMLDGGSCLWVSSVRTLFPSALKTFGIAPERIIFADLKKPKDILWAIEEGLKCDVFSAVVGELTALSFTESRRLQLAVEKSRVTGFIHRYQPRIENTVACMARWKIRSIASVTKNGMPGVGFPRWNVALTKVRNGTPGSWDIEWSPDGFRVVQKQTFAIPGIEKRKAG